MIVTVTSCSHRSMSTAAALALAVGNGDEYIHEDCSSSGRHLSKRKLQ